VSEKVGVERLVHEGMPDGQKTEYPSVDWEPVKPIYDVLNRRSIWLLKYKTGGRVLITLDLWMFEAEIPYRSELW